MTTSITSEKSQNNIIIMSSLSRSQKRNLLGKLKNHPTYGTSADSFATSVRSERSATTHHHRRQDEDFVYEFGSQRPMAMDYNEDDEIDFGSWNPENIPLLKRTVEQARTLGANRTFSWVAGIQEDEIALPESDEEEINSPWHWSRKLKVFALTVLCIVITILLLFLPEQVANYNLITVENNVDYVIDVDQLYNQSRTQSLENSLLEVTIKGSFLVPELTSLSRDKLIIRTVLDHNQTTLDSWRVGLVPDSLVQEGYYIAKSTLEQAFSLKGLDMSSQNVSLHFDTNAEKPVALSVKVQILSSRVDDGVIYGSIILVALYICITFELAHRTVIAMVGATCAIAVLATLNERPALEEIITWLDIETLTLLFSMMVIVSILSETGAFNYMGFWAFKVTKGRVWPLVAALCTITAVVSAILDNVTTILLMTPVVIQLCETVNIDPVQVLIVTVVFSNIGGAATAIGDPPNVLIASDPGLIEGGITFLNFTGHMSLCVILVFIVCAIYIRIALKNLDESPKDRELNELKHEIIIWNRTLRGLGNFTREEAVVKEIIGIKIDELRDIYEEKLGDKKSNLHHETDFPSLQSMEEANQIKNKSLLVKSGIVLTVTVILFFLQNIPSLNLSLGWTSLLGATTLLILADKAEVESIFARVEWATLIFFAALFVFMEALDKMGLLTAIGGLVEEIILKVPEDYRLAVALLLILWVSGLASAFIDNIPFTTMMIPVVTSISENVVLDLPLQPLVWALALGACLGGNGTLIGASANVVAAGVAEQHGYKFTFMDFFKIGFPMTLLSLLVASGYLMLCHVAFDWNQ